MMKAVGKIEYIGSGKVIAYQDAEEYLQAYSEALDVYGVTGGFKATTITRDPATRKAVDDLVYGAFGEDNPNDLEHYQKKCETMQGQEAARTPETEPDEELEL